MQRITKKRIAAGALLTVLGALLLWLPPQAVQLSGYQALAQQAEGVVDNVTTQNLVAFSAVSAIKTVLAVIEDSSVGIGFQLQLGDAVQTVYDYVDFVWEALLYSLLLLSAYKMVLETQLLQAGLQLMGAGILLSGLCLALPRLPAGLRRVAPRIAFTGAMFAYVVPAALLCMNFATEHYTGPVKARQAQRIQELEKQTGRLSAQIAALKGSVDLLRPVDSASALRDQISSITTTMTSTVGEATQAMLYYVVISLFELLIFPIISAWLLFKLLHLFFGRIMDSAGLTPRAAQPAAA